MRYEVGYGVLWDMVCYVIYGVVRYEVGLVWYGIRFDYIVWPYHTIQ